MRTKTRWVYLVFAVLALFCMREQDRGTFVGVEESWRHWLYAVSQTLDTGPSGNPQVHLVEMNTPVGQNAWGLDLALFLRAAVLSEARVVIIEPSFSLEALSAMEKSAVERLVVRVPRLVWAWELALEPIQSVSAFRIQVEGLPTLAEDLAPLWRGVRFWPGETVGAVSFEGPATLLHPPELRLESLPLFYRLPQAWVPSAVLRAAMLYDQLGSSAVELTSRFVLKVGNRSMQLKRDLSLELGEGVEEPMHWDMATFLNEAERFEASGEPSAKWQSIKNGFLILGLAERPDLPVYETPYGRQTRGQVFAQTLTLLTEDATAKPLPIWFELLLVPIVVAVCGSVVRMGLSSGWAWLGLFACLYVAGSVLAYDSGRWLASFTWVAVLCLIAALSWFWLAVWCTPKKTDAPLTDKPRES